MSNPSKCQILVVDDNPGVRETFALLLMAASYDVVVAEDGIAALEQLKTSLPAVIVSDLEMPRMTGFELLSVVRRRFPQILTLAMSGAYADNKVPANVIADAFFAKGGNPKELFSVLERLIVSTPDRWSAPPSDVAPAWIPRDRPDSRGMPYAMLTCEECLQVFQLEVSEETTGQVLEIPCRFCFGRSKYIIEPSIEPLLKAIA